GIVADREVHLVDSRYIEGDGGVLIQREVAVVEGPDILGNCSGRVGGISKELNAKGRRTAHSRRGQLHNWGLIGHRVAKEPGRGGRIGLKESQKLVRHLGIAALARMNAVALDVRAVPTQAVGARSGSIGP